MKLSKYIPIFGVLIMGIGLSLAGFKFSQSIERLRIENGFKEESRLKVRELREQINLNLENLLAVKAFYMSSKYVDREEFREFVRPILDRHDGIQALEWIPRVSNEERSEYVEKARLDGYPDFRITEKNDQGVMVKAGQRREYFPVYYVEPLEGNEAAQGFDLASNSTRLKSLTKARSTGESVATARITLVQEKGHQSGFLVFNSVYYNAKKLETLGHKKSLLGFVLGVFRIGDMFKKVLKSEHQKDINIYLFDETSPLEKQFLHFFPSKDYGKNNDLTKKNFRKEDLQVGMYYEENFIVGGRKWTILCTPSSNYGASLKTSESVLFLMVGLLITFFVAVYIKLSIGRTQQIEKEVIARTQELEEVNESVEKDRMMAEVARGECPKKRLRR